MKCHTRVLDGDNVRLSPELIAYTGTDTLEKSVNDVIELLRSRNIINC